MIATALLCLDIVTVSGLKRGCSISLGSREKTWNKGTTKQWWTHSVSKKETLWLLDTVLWGHLFPQTAYPILIQSPKT